LDEAGWNNDGGHSGLSRSIRQTSRFPDLRLPGLTLPWKKFPQINSGIYVRQLVPHGKLCKHGNNNIFLELFMTFSIAGFGTTYYGQSNFDEHGSYVATRWFTVAFIPLVPFSSIRRRKRESSTSFLGYVGNTSYDMVQDVPLDVTQVIKTWVYLAFIFIFGSLSEKMKLSQLVQISVLLAWLALPTILRYFAKEAAVKNPPKRVQKRTERPVRHYESLNISTCPKCRYERKQEDEAPAWQCPACKVAYNKVLAS
jgi:ssDNA-binding Zn-finger/Zn-ribbon topoisomerase 1